MTRSFGADFGRKIVVVAAIGPACKIGLLVIAANFSFIRAGGYKPQAASGARDQVERLSFAGRLAEPENGPAFSAQYAGRFLICVDVCSGHRLLRDCEINMVANKSYVVYPQASVYG
jgi:hypothetical protein